MILRFLCTVSFIFFFFFNDTATTEIYTLSLHDALPISSQPRVVPIEIFVKADQGLRVRQRDASGQIVDERDVTKSELANVIKKARAKGGDPPVLIGGDRSARYESVLAVMDELHRQGVQKVGLQVKTTQ